jgi:putative aldouronate transport system substrate-binding protein
MALSDLLEYYIVTIILQGENMRKAVFCVFVWVVIFGVTACQRREKQTAPGVSMAAPASPDAWKEKYTQPVTITFGRDGTQYEWKDGDSFANSAYTRYLKNTFNIDVKMAFIANGDDLTQRITLAIASGDLPDVLLINNRQQLLQLFQGDMVEDLTGIYDNYAGPVLKSMVESFGGLKTAMSSTYYEGKQLAASRLNLGYQDQLFWIREDWRKQLGLPEPKTTDDVVNLARAFVKSDMAGNRMTTGIEVNSASMLAGHYNGVLSIDPFFNEIGAYPRIWHDDGAGKLVYGSVTPQVKQVLSALRNMYDEGVIAKDFSTRDQNASIAAGYSGVAAGPWWTGGWPLYTTIQNNPKAIWKPYVIVGKNGKFNTYQQDIGGAWHVVRKGYAHPEALFKILSLHAEFQSSNEAPTLTDSEKEALGFMLPQSIFDAYRGQSGFDWGAWPTRVELRFNDHIIRQATIQRSQIESYKKGDRNFNANDLSDITKYVNYESGTDTSYDAWTIWCSMYGRQLELDASKNMNKQDAFYPYPTATMELRWSNLQDLELLAYTKIIMGQEPLDYFDAFVKQWYDQGGTQITKEVNDQWQMSK